jgi:hypothetical protein
MHLTLSQSTWNDLHTHMNHRFERAAFLFTKPLTDTTWAVETVWLLDGDDDYRVSNGQSLELAESIRPEVIRLAHANGYAVVEAHSHYFPGKFTRFSSYDLHGLTDFAPHMLWRLPGRPYVALVIGQDSFDALAWSDSKAAETLEYLTVGDRNLTPTGLSLLSFQKITNLDK